MFLCIGACPDRAAVADCLKTNKTLIMEQMNRIELRGMVGSVRILNYNEKTGANFTLATNQAYRAQDGTAVIETTWHNVIAWEGKNIQDLRLLDKGSKVYVMGRLKNNRYTASDGTERVASEVQASRLAILDDNESLQNEM